MRCMNMRGWRRLKSRKTIDKKGVMMDKYKFILETKEKVSETKAKSVYDYLRIIAESIGLVVRHMIKMKGDDNGS